MKNCSRALQALLASVLLAAGLVACGGTSSSTSDGGASGKSVSVLYSGGYIKLDGDKDNDDNPRDLRQDNKEFLESYGPLMSTASASPIATLVRSYYAAALAGNAAHSCALLNSALATALASESGSAHACSAGIAPLLSQEHQHLLVEDPATMTVVGVYAKGNTGLVVLGFKKAPESDIVVMRTGNAWKLDSLYDSWMR